MYQRIENLEEVAMELKALNKSKEHLVNMLLDIDVSIIEIILLIKRIYNLDLLEARGVVEPIYFERKE